MAAAVKDDRRALSAQVMGEITALMGARPLHFTFHLVSAWMVIACSVLSAIYFNAAWATIIAIVVIATRQNVLGLLVHEQAHLLGYRGKYGDVLVNLFAAYPLLVLTVEDYAQVHLAHHREYFSEKDPDFIRKSGEEWTFPKNRLETAKLFLTDVLGLNTLKLIRGKRRAAPVLLFARRHRIPKCMRPLFLVLSAGLLTWTGMWGTFLLYWVLPILTVSQLIVRWGAICEHKYNLPGASVPTSTPLILLRWWERILLPNLNFTMHPYHHFFPGISFSQLPKVHQIYVREGLVDQAEVFIGYGMYLNFITGGNAAPVRRHVR